MIKDVIFYKQGFLYFQYLQNLSEKMYVHALHTVHALPDLRLAGGRLRDVFYHALLFATGDLRTLWTHCRNLTNRECGPLL